MAQGGISAAGERDWAGGGVRRGLTIGCQCRCRWCHAPFGIVSRHHSGAVAQGGIPAAGSRAGGGRVLVSA